MAAPQVCMNERELRRLLRAFTDELRGLRKDINAIHEDQQTAYAREEAKPVEPLPIEVRTDPRIPVAIREHYEAENRERVSAWRRIKIALEVIGIASAFTLAILTFRTLCEIQKQTREITKAANASDKQATLLAQQVEGTLAAVLQLNVEMQSEGLHVVAENLGHVMADRFHAVTTLKMESRVKSFEQAYTIDVIKIPAFGAPGNAVSRVYPIDHRWIEDDWERFVGLHTRITVNIDASYGNGFAKRIPEQFCREWIPRWTVKTKNGIAGGGGFIRCEDFPAALKEITRLKQDEAKGIYR